MNRIKLFIPVLILPVVLFACTQADNRGTIAQLRNRHVVIKEEKIEGGLEKAMASYQRFLEETPESSPLKPEAIRRLADLKIEREYGHITGETEKTDRAAKKMPAPATVKQPVFEPFSAASLPPPTDNESDADFEKRATSSEPVDGTAAEEGIGLPGTDELERAGAREAIALYQKLLNEYPLYERNDQVLYQMSRAYEELGQIDEAMKVMDRLVRDYPTSRYFDEVQFRRAEYFFTRRHYLDAEDAYKSIVHIGVRSTYYQLALYKLGWTFYKQELYDEALDRYIALLDYKVSVGYDFDQTEDETEAKRTEDTFRVVSLSFSNIGGANAVVDYFTKLGNRSYEFRIYSNLAEYYYDKRRYSDATATYTAFVSRNPFHEKSPNYDMRVVEINIAGGFPSLVIDSKKEFAAKYGLKAEYWHYFQQSDRPDVLGFLKTNLKDLANHYHALYQNKKLVAEKPANFKEALHWYHEFLASFPQDEESPVINYQLASLLLENKSFAEAAVEYEKTAYNYPRHEKAADAGYTAVYAYRELLDSVPQEDKDRIKREAVRSSLKFADTFPEHEKAAIVLGAAADDLDAMGDYEQALAAAQKLVKVFPKADRDVQVGALGIIAHASFELQHYSEAEVAYVKLLGFIPEGDKSRGALVDNLAISIYKQGEQARDREDYRAAADHFLRVGVKAPTSKYRPNAEFDAAAALIQLKDWTMAATVLTGFREKFPGHELQSEVTKKIAYVYKEDGKLIQAASEYERIERESKDEEIRRGALIAAAELYEQAEETDRAIEVYRHYAEYFPHPVELNLETRNKIAEALKKKNDQELYLAELKQIVAIDAGAGSERTPRTRYLAGKGALVLAELSFGQFIEVKLVKPFEVNLRKKKELMKASTQQFNKLFEYQVGEVTAAATFYLAEIYADFSKCLMKSERPEGLNPLELEQYDLAIEEQAYPFEEKAISVHESNLELISLGIYNGWIDKSLQKLAKFVPARYDKPEVESDIIASPDSFMFARILPAPPAPPVPQGETAGTAAANGEPVKAEDAAVAETVTKAAEQPKQANTQAETKGPTNAGGTQTDVISEKAEEVNKAEATKQDAKVAATQEPTQVAKQKGVASQGEVQASVNGEEPKPSTTQTEAKAPTKVEDPGKVANEEQNATELLEEEPAKSVEPTQQPAEAEETVTTTEPKQSAVVIEDKTVKPEDTNEEVKGEDVKEDVRPAEAEESAVVAKPGQNATEAVDEEPTQRAEPKQQQVETEGSATATETKQSDMVVEDKEKAEAAEPAEDTKLEQAGESVTTEATKQDVKSETETEATVEGEAPKVDGSRVEVKAQEKADGPEQTEESGQNADAGDEKVAMPDAAVQ